MKKKYLLILAIFISSISLLTAANPEMNVLVFTKTVGFYHDAKPNAIKAFYEIAHELKWQITFTEDFYFLCKNEIK